MIYEEAEARYIAALEKNDDTRLEMAIAAKRIRDAFGKDGLRNLSRNSHRRMAALNLEADVGVLAPLIHDRPTLTFDHLVVVRKGSDPEYWLDRAVDEELSPADLRRLIAATKRQLADPAKILARANEVSEKMKTIIDEAVAAGVLVEVADRAESAAQYAKAKRNGQ